MPDPPGESVGESISREIGGIHEMSYGGPVRTVSTRIFDDSVLCLLEIDLLPHELTVLDGDCNDDARSLIVSIRRDFEQAIAPSLIGTVERATGRRVTAFLSETSIEPPFSLEYFRLDGRGVDPG